MDIQMLSSKLAKLKQRKSELRLEHTRGLQMIDAHIRELHEKRSRAIIKHKVAADSLDQEIADLLRQARRDRDATSTQTTPGFGEQPPRAASPAPTDVSRVILDILEKRKDISESLLREKLRDKGLNVSQLGKQLNTMVASGIIRRRASDYSLVKKR